MFVLRNFTEWKNRKTITMLYVTYISIKMNFKNPQNN